MTPTPPRDLRAGDGWFCDHFIEFDGLWAGTYCKLQRGHDGDHSALYPDERGRAKQEAVEDV